MNIPQGHPEQSKLDQFDYLTETMGKLRIRIQNKSTFRKLSLCLAGYNFNDANLFTSY